MVALEEISPIRGKFNAKSVTEVNSFFSGITRFDFIVALAIANTILGYVKSLSMQSTLSEIRTEVDEYHKSGLRRLPWLLPKSVCSHAYPVLCAAKRCAQMFYLT